MSGCLCSPHPTPLLLNTPLWTAGERGESRKEASMHSTNVRQIKAAVVEQAFHGTTHVSCPWGSVVPVSKRRGQLQVMIPGWGRSYPVASVRLQGAGAPLVL